MHDGLRAAGRQVLDRAFWQQACLLALAFLPLLGWDTRVFRDGIYALVIFPALGLLLLRPHGYWWTGTALEWCLLLFWSYLALTLAWSAEPASEWLGYLALVAIFFFALAAIPVARIEQFVLRSNAWPWVSVLLASIVIQYGLFHQGFDPREHGRFYLHAIGHPLLTGNVLGALGVLLIARALLVAETSSRRLAVGLALVAIMFALLMTKTRSALLGWMVASVVLVLWRLDRKTLMYFLAAGVVMAVLAAVYAPILGRGLSARPDIWKTTLAQAMESPWWGHGLGMNPQYAFTQYNIVFHDPHNGLIAVLYYGGIPALLAWLTAIGFAVRACLRQRSEVMACMALMLLAYAFVVGFFEGGYFINKPRPNWYYLWLPLALVLAVDRSRRHAA